MIRPLAMVVLVLLAGAAPAVAQDSETKVVLRISREFLRTFLRARFETDQPISDNSAGVAVAGNAHVLGGFDVKLHRNGNDSDFDLTVNGTVATQITATRRPVIVCAHGDGPFNAARRIHFDQKVFTAGPICMTVSHHFRLDGIDTIRHGPLSPLVRGVARPIARRGLLDGDSQADAQIRTQIADQVEEETDRLVKIVNHIEAVFAEVKRIVSKKLNQDISKLQIFRTATEEELLISVGARMSVLPKLPNLPEKQHAPLELWLSSKILANEPITADHPKLLEFEKELSNLLPSGTLKTFLEKQLLRRYEKQIKAIEEKIHAQVDVKLVHVPNSDWIVLTFAPIQLKELPIIKLGG